MDLLDAFKSAQAGFKARKLRERTQKSRWRKRKKKETNLGRRRWRKRVAYHINYKSKRLTRDSFGFEQESINVKNEELFLFARVKKFGMQEGIKMSEQPGQPIDLAGIIAPYHDQPFTFCDFNRQAFAFGVRVLSDIYKEHVPSTPIFLFGGRV